jgi:hypothetical protein
MDDTILFKRDNYQQCVSNRGDNNQKIQESLETEE